MRLVIALLLALAAVAADNPADRIRAAMRESLDKQRSSVRMQVQTATAAPAAQDFYTVPWPEAPALAPVADCDPVPDAELSTMVTEAATRNSLEARLVRAVIRKESAGRPCAVSPKGAQGLMQIMPETASTLGLADPFDPKQNVDAGTKFLKALIDRFKGSLPLALAAYNAGPLAVEKAGGIPEFAETKDYVAEILKSLNEVTDR